MFDPLPDLTMTSQGSLVRHYYGLRIGMRCHCTLRNLVVKDPFELIPMSIGVVFVGPSICKYSELHTGTDGE